MKTIPNAIELEQCTASIPMNFPFLWRCWNAVQAWRQRARLRAVLYGMKDHELMDFGMARGEIEYVVRNGTDPNGEVFGWGMPRSRFSDHDLVIGDP